MSAAAQSAAVVAPSQAKPKKKSSGWNDLKSLLPYLRKYKGMTAVGLITLTLMGAVGALPQLIIGMITDCLQGAPQTLTTLHGYARYLLTPLIGLYAPLSRHTLGAFCIVLVCVMFVKGFFSFWTRWILIGVSREIEYDLRNDMLERLVAMEPEFYVRNRTGDLMSRATNDLNAVRMVLGPGIMYSATTVVTMLPAVYFMFKLAPSLALWVFVPVPVVAFAVRFFGETIHRLSEKIQAALGVLSTRAQENLTGIRVIRAYAQEQQEIAAFDNANRDYVDQNIKLISTWSLFFPFLTALIGVTFVILLGKGGKDVIDHRFAVGTMWAFYWFLGQLVFPMIALGWVTNIFQRGAASMGRLNFILHAKPSICDDEPGSAAPVNGNRAAAGAAVSASKVATAAPPIRGDIEFKHLTFTYPTAPEGQKDAPASAQAPVLKDINLHIPAGSTLAIVGPTGSGKSTLAALVARLWEAPEGTLLLDGRSIRQFPLAELRRAIGYVPQDTFLFSDTLKENIAFGVETALENQVYEAAEIASLSNEINSFPKTYETMVGERGITLSGGQKQRTSIARAVVREPRILILDDALSSVDTDTEEKILASLRNVMRERTSIVISHRVSTVKNADQIVVLREGRIIERGTHDQLLALNGYYADLNQKQMLEEELARE
ncbi:MAG: ABC transporter ATP-binding protein [Candidatus Acidiferrales bacterium]